MKSLLLIFGRVGYYLGYPVLALLLNKDARTRVVIRHNHQVLLVKSWLGNGAWDLPGGGLHKAEAPLQGALREVQEEIGIDLGSYEVKMIKTLNFKFGLIRYKAHYFEATLENKPKLKLQKLEIIDAQWFDPDQIKDIKLNPQLRYIIGLR